MVRRLSLRVRPMLASLRRFAGTWPAKIFFVLLIASFGLWGVADVARNLIGGNIDPDTVATVGGQKITAAELQDAARRTLIQVMRNNPNPAPPTAEQRRMVASRALDGLVIVAAFTAEAARLHVSVPDEALRRATFDTTAFQGPDGQFNRAIFASVLRENGYTEARYLSLLRTDIGQRALVEAVRAGGVAPELVNRLVFAHDGETRVADLVTLPFAGAAEPPAPTDEQLARQYDDNARLYRAPEYRRIKVVILSPESVAKDIEVSDADARAYYESHKADFTRLATRSVQVVVAPTQAAAQAIASAWLTGADWDTVQKQAAAAHASALELEDQTQDGFPAPDLAGPIFAAPPQAVTGPEQAGGGWAVFRVTKDTPAGQRPLEDALAEVKAKAALDQATDQVYDRANKVQDALAGGARLDELPAGLGLAAVTGTLDAQGNTPDGGPAPIPGGPDLRLAITLRAFALAPGDPATLEDGPEHSFYAVSVDAVTPPAQLPLEQVRDRVRDDWLRDARRHEQDVAATALMTAVEGGATLQAAAAAAGQPVTRSAPLPIAGAASRPGWPARCSPPSRTTPTWRRTRPASSSRCP